MSPPSSNKLETERFHDLHLARLRPAGSHRGAAACGENPRGTKLTGWSPARGEGRESTALRRGNAFD